MAWPWYGASAAGCGSLLGGSRCNVVEPPRKRLCDQGWDPRYRAVGGLGVGKTGIPSGAGGEEQMINVQNDADLGVADV